MSSISKLVLGCIFILAAGVNQAAEIYSNDFEIHQHGRGFYYKLCRN